MGSYEFIQKKTVKGIKLFPIAREELNKMLEAGTAQPNPKWPKIYQEIEPPQPPVNNTPPATEKPKPSRRTQSYKTRAMTAKKDD